MDKRKDLITAINSKPEKLKEFQEGWGRETVEEYLDEYSHIEDIVDRLAQDLDIDLQSGGKS